MLLTHNSAYDLDGQCCCSANFFSFFFLRAADVLHVVFLVDELFTVEVTYKLDLPETM